MKKHPNILLILLIFAILLFSACVDHNEQSDTDIYLEYKSVIIDHINDVFFSLQGTCLTKEEVEK